MSISAPGLTLAVEALFAFIRPSLVNLTKLGATDFSDGVPGVDVKPGATVKIPVSSVSAASVYHDDNNNYLTGGDTAWATLTAAHYLQGFDMKGTDIDAGVSAPRIKQLFSRRCGMGIVMAAQGVTKTALDAVTASTGVTLPAAPSIAQYAALGGATDWLDKASSVLAVSGAEMGLIKGAFFDKGVVGTDQELAAYMGYADIVVIPGLTSRIVVVPSSALGFMARVPEIVARYAEAGAETDPETGLSIGIVVADDQAKNRQVVNGDLWFGCTIQSCAAAATTPGCINVGTSN